MKRAFEVKQKINFLASQVLSFRHAKQTSKNVADTTFKFDLGHILKWLKVNSLKPNPGKFQFMILRTNTDIQANLFLDGNKIQKNFQEVILPRITVDDKLSFKMHIENNC